jgi:tetratricopeptide (TPR) repeat protein
MGNDGGARMGNRYGLLIGADSWEDDLFAQIPPSFGNLAELARLLQGRSNDEDVPIVTLRNESRATIENEIVRLFRKREDDDMLFLYYSGLGVLDETGSLYLGVRDTERDFPDVTGISAHFISRLMDKSGSANIVVVLDCVFVGAATKLEDASVMMPVNVGEAFRGSGYGRGLVAAVDRTSYRWLGERLYAGSDRRPALTEWMIEGLRDSRADHDRDGLVTDRDLVDYVTGQSAEQPPLLFTYQRERDIIVAGQVLPSAAQIAGPDIETTASSVPVQRQPGKTWVRQTVFINYGGDDRDKAAAVTDLLERSGYRVWMDRKVIEGSDNWKVEIDRGLRSSFVMIALLTASSVAPDRTWVHYEQRQAVDLFLPIIPVMFEDCTLPERLSRINYVDFRGSAGETEHRLLRAVERHVLREGAQLFDEAPIMERLFVGRSEELRRIHAAITSDELDAIQARPTIAIHGLAGSGKSMLLRELIRRLGRRYPGGVIYEQRGENGLTNQAILRRWLGAATGERVEREVTPQEVRAKLLQYGELIVAFDDVWAEDFLNVKLLINALPTDTTRLLTTQFRDEAQAIGCEVFPLDHPLEKMSDEDALRLLTDRLRGKGPVPDDGTLLRLAHTVDNHPLALEISAGQCQYTGDLAEITDELVRDLDEGVSSLRYRNLLRVNASTSITMSFDRSLRALDAWDRQVGTTYVHEFHVLGIFPDNVPLTRDIISATWCLSRSRQVTETLSALIDRALLVRDMQGLANYRIHPLLRAYARELLLANPDEHAAARQRYVGLITGKARELFARPQDQWDTDESFVRHIMHTGRMLMSDIERMIGADRFAELSQPMPEEAGLPSLGAALDQQLLTLTGSFVEAIMPLVRERPELGDVVVWCLSAGLVAARLAPLAAPERVVLLHKELGAWHSRHSRYAEALRYLASATSRARAVASRRLLAESLREYGTAQALANDVARAIRSHTEALAIHRELGSGPDIADALLDLGHDHWILSEASVALAMYDEALRANPELNARALDHVGSAHFVLSDFDRAIDFFGQALVRARAERSLAWEAEASNDMGAALIGKGDYLAALPHLARAAELYARVGDRRVESISLFNRATCLRRLGQLDEAEQLNQRGLDIAREIGAAKAQVWALQEMGLICQVGQRYTEARNWFAEALRIFTEAQISDRRTEAGVLGNFGWLLFVGFPDTDRDRAQAYTAQALQLLIDNGLPRAQTHLTVEELRRRLDQIRSVDEAGADTTR